MSNPSSDFQEINQELQQLKIHLGELRKVEKLLFEAAIEAFDKNDYPLAKEIFLDKLFHLRPASWVYRHNLLISDLKLNNGIYGRLCYEGLMNVVNDFELKLNHIEDRHLEYSVMYYNIALLLLSKGHVDSSLSIVEKVRQVGVSKSVSAIFRRKIHLFHIELLVHAKNFAKALTEIESYESKSIPLEPSVIIKLLQLKTCCFISMKNFKCAKKEYKALFALTGSTHPSYYVGSFLKANHDYLRGNYTKAHKTMETLERAICKKDDQDTFFRQTGDNIPLMCKNNQACCLFYSNKPTVAEWRFRDALKEIDKWAPDTDGNTPLPYYCASQTKSVDLINYNLGITLHHKGRSLEALPYLTKSLKKFPKNPRLWLRVAEACVHILKDTSDFSLTAQQRGFNNKHQDVFNLIMAGVHEKSNDSPAFTTKMAETEEVNIMYANLCLDKALELMESCQSTGYVEVLPSNPITAPEEITILKAAILCLSSYVNLKLHLFYEATLISNQLLSLEGAPSGYICLAKSYIGIAALRLGDIETVNVFINKEDEVDINYVPTKVDRRDETATGEFVYIASNSNQELYHLSKDWAAARLAYSQILLSISVGNQKRALPEINVWLKRFGSDLPFKFLLLALELFTWAAHYDIVEWLREEYFFRFYPQLRVPFERPTLF